MRQPPFQYIQQRAQCQHQHQIDGRHAQQREHGLVGAVHDALRRIQQLLAPDHGDERSILEQDDELIAQRRQDRADGLRDDNEYHGGDVVQPQAAPRFHLAGVHGHQAAADDLGHIRAGVDAQRQRADHREVAAAGKDDHAHDEQLDHHRRAADDRGIDAADHIQHAQHRVVAAGLLLVVGHAHQRHQRAQQHAQHQRDGRDQQRGAHALQILLPAIRIQERLIKFDEEILPKGQGPTAFRQFRKCFELCFHPLHNLSCYDKEKARRGPGVPFTLSGVIIPR